MTVMLSKSWSRRIYEAVGCHEKEKMQLTNGNAINNSWKNSFRERT